MADHKRMSLQEFQQFWLEDHTADYADHTTDDFMAQETWEEMYNTLDYSNQEYVMDLFLAGVESNADSQDGSHPMAWNVVETWTFEEDETHTVNFSAGDRRVEITLGTGHTFEVTVRRIDGPTRES